MATKEDILQAIRNADAAGDSAAVRKLAAYLGQLSSQEQAPDPTEGMSAMELGFAGFGKAFTDVARGSGQLLRNVMPDRAADAIGLPTQQDIDEAKATDAALMNTTAGKVGNVAGSVAAALPTVFIPGAQGITGAALTGAGLGLVQPVATGESRLQNTAVGAAAGAGGVVAGRVLAAGAKGAKALVDPFTSKGRTAIAGRTMERFGVTADDVAGATSRPTVTGARLPLAEQITRPEGAAGAARLQDSMRVLDPELAGQITAREVQNNAARVNTLRDLAGHDGAREFADASRQAAAKKLYGDAFAAKPASPNGVFSAAERGEITKLMNMPAIKSALKDAQIIAKNQGKSLGKPDGSVEGLHNMKLALDDQINSLMGGSAAEVNKAMSIKAARDRLVTFIQRVSPEYGEARATYAAMSKPVNQMDVADTLFRKGTSATSDLWGTPRLMPDRFVNLLKNEETTVKSATGRDLGKLSELLDPDQFSKVMAVGKELDRQAAVGRAANGPGSATAQRLASQNVLRQVLGPTGLPESWAESTLLNTAMRPVQFVYNGVAEPKIQAVLSDLLLNPDKARAVLQAAQTSPRRLPAEVQAALPYLEQAMRTTLPATTVSGQR